MKFKIVESGGKTVKRIIQKANPTSSGGEGGGSCWKSNLVYEYSCQLCPENKQAVYIGETACNLYTRGREHVKNCKKRDTESFIHRHQAEKHSCAEPTFKAKVIYGVQDCLSRQVAEGVCIRR